MTKMLPGETLNILTILNFAFEFFLDQLNEISQEYDIKRKANLDNSMVEGVIKREENDITPLAENRSMTQDCDDMLRNSSR